MVLLLFSSVKFIESINTALFTRYSNEIFLPHRICFVLNSSFYAEKCTGGFIKKGDNTVNRFASQVLRRG